ncbi:MAG: LL-diaminopimelate aminotransferase [Candidatus Promineifilaceae bacterium]|jgi:LL-diaminopimelate aminotransferase
MSVINSHFQKLEASYLFSDIAKRVNAFSEANPDSPLIKLGIGDVTEPLAPAIVEAFQKGVTDLASADTFRGYGPEQGYDFLREAIAKHDFQTRGADIQADEIFVSDGAKCDSGNFQELFATSTVVAVPDPVYPVYVDTNVMAGRTGAAENGRYAGLVYLEGRADNGYVPSPPDTHVDLIYLCFPNNPTGATATREQLKEWVDYAHREKAIILFDAAYEAFITDPDIPHSIFEIEGARDVAVEFRSFSKTAGFTGTRCAYTVVPKACMASDESGNAVSLHALWNRRHCTKFNGVSYPVQRAAEATYSDEGRTQVRALVNGYLANATHIADCMRALNYTIAGGENSPYIWVQTGGDSWNFFDRLLKEASVVVTPGAGFGTCGEGYIRISAFNSSENVATAMQRITAALS